MRDLFNPKRPFRSVEELGNYLKKEMTEENMIKNLANIQQPINVVDSRHTHLVLSKTLDKLPADTLAKKRWISLLKCKSYACMYNNRHHLGNKNVNKQIAKAIGCSEKEFLIEEKRALEFVKNEINKRDLGTGQDVILN